MGVNCGRFGLFATRAMRKPCGNHAGKSIPPMLHTTNLGTKFGVVSCFAHLRPLERFFGFTMREHRCHKIEKKAPAMRTVISVFWIEKSTIFIELSCFFDILETPNRKTTKIVGTSARDTFFSHAECKAYRKKTNARN